MPSTYYVDGYNVLHKSAELRPLARQDLESARDGLVDKIAVFCALSANKVFLVFDGRGQERHARPEKVAGAPGLSMVYTASGITADAYIEREVYKCTSRLSVVVVSNDRGLRDLCRNMGSLTMEADHFLETLREAKADTSATVASTQRNSCSDSIEHRLDGNVLAQLERLRQDLEKKTPPQAQILRGRDAKRSDGKP